MNLSIWENLAGVLWALKKPFCIMGDWNVTPETLDESGWVTSIGGAFVDSGRPTRLQGDAARNYDYCVVSSHWVHRPTASLYEAWAPGLHTAVLFEVP